MSMLTQRIKDSGSSKDKAKKEQNNVKKKYVQASYTLETALQGTGEQWTVVIKRLRKEMTIDLTLVATAKMQPKKNTDKVKFKIRSPAILVSINYKDLPTLARKIRVDVNQEVIWDSILGWGK